MPSAPEDEDKNWYKNMPLIDWARMFFFSPLGLLTIVFCGEFLLTGALLINWLSKQDIKF